MCTHVVYSKHDFNTLKCNFVTVHIRVTVLSGQFRLVLYSTHDFSLAYYTSTVQYVELNSVQCVYWEVQMASVERGVRI